MKPYLRNDDSYYDDKNIYSYLIEIQNIGILAQLLEAMSILTRKKITTDNKYKNVMMWTAIVDWFYVNLIQNIFNFIYE